MTSMEPDPKPGRFTRLLQFLGLRKRPPDIGVREPRRPVALPAWNRPTRSKPPTRTPAAELRVRNRAPERGTGRDDETATAGRVGLAFGVSTPRWWACGETSARTSAEHAPTSSACTNT